MRSLKFLTTAVAFIAVLLPSTTNGRPVMPAVAIATVSDVLPEFVAAENGIFSAKKRNVALKCIAIDFDGTALPRFATTVNVEECAFRTGAAEEPGLLRSDPAIARIIVD